jgi:periplasmic protein CpxP/Spy
MNKVKLLGSAVAILLLINGAILILLLMKPSHPISGRPGAGPDEPKRVIIGKLHFNEDQIEKYEKLVGQHRVAVSDLEKQIRDTKTNLYLTLSNGKSVKRDSLERQLGLLQSRMERIHYNHFAEIRKLCRTDQMEYFNELTHELASFFGPRKNLPPPPRD